jgi:hypothetical protein
MSAKREPFWNRDENLHPDRVIVSLLSMTGYGCRAERMVSSRLKESFLSPETFFLITSLDSTAFPPKARSAARHRCGALCALCKYMFEKKQRAREPTLRFSQNSSTLPLKKIAHTMLSPNTFPSIVDGTICSQVPAPTNGSCARTACLDLAHVIATRSLSSCPPSWPFPDAADTRHRSNAGDGLDPVEPLGFARNTAQPVSVALQHGSAAMQSCQRLCTWTK